jgi:peptidoglycan/xylan/chitin deacetylase (PgdA/CDA1 family)
MGPLPVPSVGLVLAVVVLGIVAVVDNGSTARAGSVEASPPPVVSAPAPGGRQSPMPRPTKKSQSETWIAKSQKHSSAKAGSATPNSPGTSQASGKHRSGPSGEAPARRGGTVYLTFDDGPSPYTPAILNILSTTHSTATFFELGFRQAEYPAEAAHIRAQGSSVGNHTYNHPNLTKLTAGQIRWQIAHGPRSRCVRPPYGATNSTVRHIMSQQGLHQVLWTIDTRDWSRPGTKHIVEAATASTVRSGTIVLMHDGGGNRSQTVAALPQVIAALQQRGFVIRGIPGC